MADSPAIFIGSESRGQQYGSQTVWQLNGDEAACMSKRGGVDGRMSSLDSGWIEDGLLKRKSNYSPVVVYETSDPKRVLQLKQFMLRDSWFGEFDHILVYDQWEGLGRLVLSPSGPAFEPYRKRLVGGSPLGERLSASGGFEINHLKSALREVDQSLKASRSAVILQNLSENREWETGLEGALRAWATDPNVITKGSVIFIIAQDSERLLSDYTKDLAVVLTVDESSAKERAATIFQIAAEFEINLCCDHISELSFTTAGLNLHQLESILLETYFKTGDFDTDTIRVLKSNLVKRSGILEITDPLFGFSDIGGYEVIKDFVKKNVIDVLKFSDRARRFSLPLPRGILFFGPPGNGKSLFANALAKEIKLPFINLVTENIYSKWLGESGQRMKNAIRLAEKMSPAIVFVDEIDRFGKRTVGTDGSAGEETRRVFSQFLEWLGRPDREAVIVGTTNVPEHLDEAFTRTGRFDYKIPLLYPGKTARLDVLAVHLGLKGGSRRPKAPLRMPSDEMLLFLRNEVVPLTSNYSCAELEELVIRSKRAAFNKGKEVLEPEDFLEAASSFTIDARQREKSVSFCMEQARRFTDDRSFVDAIQDDT